MIRLEFYGFVIEGEISYYTSPSLLIFRVQYPIREEAPFNHPTLNGRPLREIARVKNLALGRATSYAVEFDVQDAGDLVIESYMALGSKAPNIFRLGVQRTDSGILISEAVPHPYPWFINGDFVEPGEEGVRQFVVPDEEDSGPDPGRDEADDGEVDCLD